MKTVNYFSRTVSRKRDTFLLQNRELASSMKWKCGYDARCFAMSCETTNQNNYISVLKYDLRL